MDIFLAVAADGRPYLRFMAQDGKGTMAVRKAELTNEQLEIVLDLQKLEKPSEVSPWEAVYRKHFIRRAGSTLSGAQVIERLKAEGYRSTKEQAEFRQWLGQERGIEVKLGHAGRRTYYHLALRST
jgi:hypothetical protein